jgi:hypothetical protein
MPDAEAPSPQRAQSAIAYPKRGASIHAVEGGILGVVALAWVMLRLQLSGTCLADEVILLSYFVASLFNLLGCTLVSDRDFVQGAYFGLCLCLWLTYAYLVVESLLVTGGTAVGVNPYAHVFFGSMQLFQVAAGFSFALITLVTLLAGGAVSQRLWQQTLWMEGLVLLLAGVQAGLCKSMVIVLLDAVGVVLLGLPVVGAWGWLFDSLLWKLGHLLVFITIGVVALITAWANQTTTVGLPLFLVALTLLILVRFLQPLPPIDYAAVSQLLPSEDDDPPPAAGEPQPQPSAPPMFPAEGPAKSQAQGSFLTPVTFGGEMPLFVPASAIRQGPPLLPPDALLFGKVSRPRISKKTL